MQKIVFICFYLLISCNFFAQKSYSKHTVVSGENIFQIAQKYKVTAQEIYDMNPDSKNGVKSDMILIIPNSTNSNIIKGSSSNIIKHEVLQKETLYGIAKQYGITIDEIKNANPILETVSLSIGQIIDIPNVKGKVLNKVSQTVKSTAKPISKNIQYVDYEVKSKETLYGLSKKFNLTIDELLSINPELSNGVQEAMTIKVPAIDTVANNQNIQIAEKTATKIVLNSEKQTQKELIEIKVNNSNYIDLTKSINLSERKKLAILLPFNALKIQSDTVVSQQERIRNNKFLNMTLDFYSGVLMAIDSAKTLGLNIDIKILDSQETKTSSNIENLVSEHNLQSQDAIIGPFYQNQVDKMAEMLQKSSVSIISPLSKEEGKPFKNVYASMPSGDLLKVAMFDYMRQKNGNIIAVIDTKKVTIKQYITDNQQDVKFAAFNDKGVLLPESLKVLLDKDKINYIVFASEKTSIVFSVTNTLLNALSNYQIRLVILEPNPTFDYEEIGLSRLTKLKLTYPSLTRENETDNGRIFEKEFKKKNKIFPNQYATRGFDITFDTMLRLSQNGSFEQNATNVTTEQVENKFDYKTNLKNGFVNKGVYILQYNNDLTISEAQ